MSRYSYEKEYRIRRTKALETEMISALDRRDYDAFQSAFSKALNYMHKKEYSALYRRFLSQIASDV